MLKEVIRYFTTHGSPMFLCYLDASKAFDRINHGLLVKKLFENNVPLYIIRIIHAWYGSQLVCIKWGNEMSNFFNVSNGIRQGSILSPLLFSMYFDSLSRTLNTIDVGCYFNYLYLNHLMYADDVILVCPSTHGLQKLIDACGKYGLDHDVIFNDKKTVCMIIRTKKYNNFVFSNFTLNERELKFVNKYKYLGHIITDNLCDDDDIYRQISCMYARGNILVKHFRRCSPRVKTILFNTHITNVYCCHLWCSFKSKSFNDFRVAYNNIFRSLFNIPRHLNGITVSVSNAQLENNVPSSTDIVSRVAKSLHLRLHASPNELISRFIVTEIFRGGVFSVQWGA